jgi:hypothetical protein
MDEACARDTLLWIPTRPSKTRRNDNTDTEQRYLLVWFGTQWYRYTSYRVKDFQLLLSYCMPDILERSWHYGTRTLDQVRFTFNKPARSLMLSWCLYQTDPLWDLSKLLNIYLVVRFDYYHEALYRFLLFGCDRPGQHYHGTAGKMKGNNAIAIWNSQSICSVCCLSSKHLVERSTM